MTKTQAVEQKLHACHWLGKGNRYVIAAARREFHLARVGPKLVANSRTERAGSVIRRNVAKRLRNRTASHRRIEFPYARRKSIRLPES